MTAPVTLLLAIHCHQPVGNFGFVFEEAYAKAYEPFLGALERHPGVRMALHYSGPLLDWLQANRPEFLARVRALAASGQVEVLASGYYEPILPLIPEADRQGQIAMMREAVAKLFKTRADGLWLTERVWEPDLPQTLAHAGIRYTMVDTNQFALAKPWLPADLQREDGEFWDVLGAAATEYGGRQVALFPASKRLRYWLPFQPVEKTVGFLRSLQGERPVSITFADDGEKFGLWPKTFDHVYTDGWLDRFFSALEQEQAHGWLATSTFRDHLDAVPPAARVYLPCGSYEEMLEWSGGHFRNFYSKYPEANAMQQKMLGVSRRVAEARERTVKSASGKLDEAVQALYAGQCNCAYWHGIFGGLYLAHLRRAVYDRLLAAEALVNRPASGGAAAVEEDTDGDGAAELSLTSPAMRLVVDPADGGALAEWSLYGPRVNLLDTITRRPEPYHAKLKAAARQPVAAGEGPASIHDLTGAKEEHLESRLIYDRHRRQAMHDYAFSRMPSLQEAVQGAWESARLWDDGPFARSRAGAAPLSVSRRMGTGRILKQLKPGRDGATLECVYALQGLDAPVAALEFNLGLRDRRYLEHAGQRDEAGVFELEEPDLGVWLQVEASPGARLYHFPIDTVSESEGGLERTYQGLALVWLWPAAVTGGTWTGRLTWTIRGRQAATGRKGAR